MTEHSITISLTKAQRIALAEICPELEDRLKLDENHSRTIAFDPNEVISIQEEALYAVEQATEGMKRNSYRHIADAAKKALEKSEGIGSIPSCERVFQFKITLIDSNPPIWRRIQVRNSTLDKLHERIQLAMGWQNCHLHLFEIDGERYSDPRLMQYDFDDRLVIDTTITKLDETLPKNGKPLQFLYSYDFGDDWRHEILFEGCLQAKEGQRFPVCVEGERACPPEDVGGVWGYENFLEAIVDPKHEEHEMYMEWAGKFDPEEFDAQKATKKMRRGLPNWRE